MDKTEKVYYYRDEQNDDFAGVQPRKITVDESFCFAQKNIFWRALAFIVYRVIMTPFAYLFCKIKFNVKIENKSVLKQYKNKSFFIYGNHTQIPADAFFPNIFLFPKKAFFIVSPDNIATRGTQNFMKMLGAIPLPTKLSGMRGFTAAIKQRTDEGAAVVVFPEAHIWPYYTKIRPFPSVSFKYPLKYNVPVFCFTTTYQKRKHIKRPRATVYIDGPFFADKEKTSKQNEQLLRDAVYAAMCNRALKSDCEYIKYIKEVKS